MTDSPLTRGLSTAGAPALEHAPDPRPEPTEPHRTPFSAFEQDAPRGAGVQDLRPLRGRPFGPIPDPDALPDAAQQQADDGKEKDQHADSEVDRPRSFRNDQRK
jgi:hypothetical protein